MATVEEELIRCEGDINHLRLNGMSTVVVIEILERFIAILRTVALHTMRAKIE